MASSAGAAAAAAALRGVEDVAEGEGDVGLNRAEVKALRSKRWEDLLRDDSTASGGDDFTRAALGSPRHRSRSPRRHAERPVSQVDDDLEVQADTPLRRGMVRYVYLVLDMTEAMKQNDYKPQRLDFAVEQALRFLRLFFTENPLATLALAVLRGGTCEVISGLSNNPEVISRHILAAAKDGPRGRMSIVNGLLRVLHGLERAPSYGTREALFLVASLSTHDPAEEPLEKVLAPLREKRIRVSMVSMCPEIYVFKHICMTTGGHYSVALDSNHFQKLLGGHIVPPACDAEVLTPKLICMGFPSKDVDLLGYCACHLCQQTQSYTCPKCKARVCEIPGKCDICNLPLTTASLLARSFQHLHLTPPFIKSMLAVPRPCSGCQVTAQETYRCPRCSSTFCDACDEYIHSVLRQCPGCLRDSFEQRATDTGTASQ